MNHSSQQKIPQESISKLIRAYFVLFDHYGDDGLMRIMELSTKLNRIADITLKHIYLKKLFDLISIDSFIAWMK